MVDSDSDLQGDRPRTLKPHHVWITRRRWDIYWLPVILTAVTLAIVAPRQFWPEPRRTRLAAAAMVSIPWLYFRIRWPREGRAVPTLDREPKTKPMLVWCALMLLLVMVGWISLDLLGQFPTVGQLWSVRQVLVVAGFMVAWSAITLVGGLWIERRFKKPAVPVNHLNE
jgi:hypothetical protein